MPTGTILAYSIPDGAEVFVDRIAMSTRFGTARTPTMIPEIPAGTHTVTFILPGYIEEVKYVNVAQGGYATVYGILRPVTTSKQS